MASNPEQMETQMIANLPDKTGRSLSEWLVHLAAMRESKHGEIVKVLKAEHHVGHGYANLIAQHLRRVGGVPSEDDLVAAQYAGRKADLRPIYEALIERVVGFGSDVEISPKKTYVSLRRSKQFGLVQPSTSTRVDVGIKLVGEAAKGRLEPSGSFNAMVSHRVRVSEASEVDDELENWLKQAYEQA